MSHRVAKGDRKASRVSYALPQNSVCFFSVQIRIQFGRFVCFCIFASSFRLRVNFIRGVRSVADFAQIAHFLYVAQYRGSQLWWGPCYSAGLLFCRDLDCRRRTIFLSSRHSFPLILRCHIKSISRDSIHLQSADTDCAQIAEPQYKPLPSKYFLHLQYASEQKWSTKIFRRSFH